MGVGRLEDIEDKHSARVSMNAARTAQCSTLNIAKRSALKTGPRREGPRSGHFEPVGRMVELHVEDIQLLQYPHPPIYPPPAPARIARLFVVSALDEGPAKGHHGS